MKLKNSKNPENENNTVNTENVVNTEKAADSKHAVNTENNSENSFRINIRGDKIKKRKNAEVDGLSSQKYDFLNEKILDNDKNNIARLILLVIIFAMIFGIVACITFFWVKPYIKDFFEKDEEAWVTTESNTMSEMESDELIGSGVTSGDNSSTEDGETSGNNGSSNITETKFGGVSEKDFQNAVNNALADYSIGINNYKEMYSKLKKVSEKVEKYMVTIIVDENENNWYENNYGVKSITSGIIVGKDNGIHILTDYKSIAESNNVKVVLPNSHKYSVSVAGKSEIMGIAVLTIDEKDIEESEIENMDVAVYDDINTMENGDGAIFMGNPYGTSRYMAYGAITSVKNELVITDNKINVMATNLNSSGNMNGFLIDFNGCVLGMYIPELTKNSMSGVVSSVDIANLEPYIELMKNNKKIPYIGISGQEVTDEIIKTIDEEMPYGIYISNTEAGSPAYNAGIMNGDIIVQINEKNIRTFTEYADTLLKLKGNEEIEVEVKRKGKDGYKNIEYKFSITAY